MKNWRFRWFLFNMLEDVETLPVFVCDCCNELFTMTKIEINNRSPNVFKSMFIYARYGSLVSPLPAETAISRQTNAQRARRSDCHGAQEEGQGRCQTGIQVRCGPIQRLHRIGNARKSWCGYHPQLHQGLAELFSNIPQHLHFYRFCVCWPCIVQSYILMNIAEMDCSWQCNVELPWTLHRI